MTTQNPLPRGASLPTGQCPAPAVMDIVDVGLHPSALSSFVMCGVPPPHRNGLATALQQVRLHSSFEEHSSYSSDSPSGLDFKHLVTSQAPQNHLRPQIAFPD